MSDNNFSNVVGQQLLATLKAIEEKPQIPLTVANWDSKLCGVFFCKTAKYFTEHIASNPDFPHSTRLKSGKGKGQPLWAAREVIKWFKEQS